ncbi:hypothetical protein, partial [Alistipes dispar]|uniref:hypothetical protein n=1 Tax=Alistipes dispar TaxID=2585119 RepID=UPI003A886E55
FLCRRFLWKRDPKKEAVKPGAARQPVMAGSAADECGLRMNKKTFRRDMRRKGMLIREGKKIIMHSRIF